MQGTVRRFHVISFHTEGGRTVTPMTPGTPANALVAEDGVTVLVAEDGVTVLVTES